MKEIRDELARQRAEGSLNFSSIVEKVRSKVKSRKDGKIRWRIAMAFFNQDRSMQSDVRGPSIAVHEAVLTICGWVASLHIDSKRLLD